MKYFEHVKGSRLRYSLSIFLTLLVSLLANYAILLRADILNLLIDKNNNIFKLMLILLVMVLSNEILSLFLSLNNAFLMKKWNIKLSNQISEKITGISYNQFHKMNPGDYISWYTGDLPVVSQYLFRNSIDIVNRVILSIISLVVLFFINIKIGLVSLVLLVLSKYIGSIFGKKIGESYQYYAIINSKFNNKLQEFLKAYDLIKNYNKIPFYKNHINNSQEELEDKMYNIRRLTSYANLVSLSLQKLFEVFIFVLTGILVFKGELKIGTLLVTPAILDIFLTNTMLVLESFIQMKGGYPMYEKITKYEKSEMSQYPELKEQIVFDNVSFGYDEKDILKDFNMDIKKNHKYAIIGESGAGKSTVLQLIVGRLSEKQGSILIDGNSLPKDKEVDFSKQIAYCTQENFTFSLSIRENLTLGENYTDEQINKVLKEVKLYDVIEAKKDKLETSMLELSGGEKQRIALARALLTDAAVIILDEATSAVDKKNTKEIEDILLSKNDKTLILISHHLDEQTKNRFDEVYEIKK